MKPFFRILLLLIIIWLGYKTIRQESGGFELGIIYQFQFIPFILLIIFTIASFVLDSTFYQLDKKIVQYSVSFIGLGFIIFVVIKIIQRHSIDNSKSVINISNMGGAENVMKFEFKKNKYFRLTEYNRLGQIVYYGKYSKINDSIKILESNYDGFAKRLPETGLIKNDTVFWNGFDTMLVDKK